MTEEQQVVVNRVAVKVPPFWPMDPELWFVQVENQFSLAGVTTDETKYAYVASTLDAKIASEVRDILINPPATERYEKLKTELILRLSASQEQKTRRLLEHEEIGDRKPSQFLRHLRALAGTVVPDTVIKPLWLTRLHPSTQAILATQKSVQLDDLAELADAVVQANPRPQIAQVDALPVSAMEAMMERLTSMMTAKMEELSTSLRQEVSAITDDRSRRSGSRSSPLPRTRSRSRNNAYQPGVCWYHARFGSAASKCTKPCTFTPASENFQGSH